VGTNLLTLRSFDSCGLYIGKPQAIIMRISNTAIVAGSRGIVLKASKDT